MKLASTQNQRVSTLNSKLDQRAAAVMDGYPAKVRNKLLRLRKLIFDTATEIEGVGAITETLKWGEPAYLTEASKSGSTIRLGWKQKKPDQFAVYFNCNTTLVDTFRTLFPELKYEGNRAIVFKATEKLPMEPLHECIALALTYHQGKKALR